MHVLVVAKSPVAGRVKTRLVPPLTHAQAAEVAQAALAQTLQAVADSAADRKLLALDGEPGAWIPPGFTMFPQVLGGFDRRLAAAWSQAGGPGLQIGMDTPQASAGLIDRCLARLAGPELTAVLGPAEDGGWWAIGIRERWWTDVFTGVPMSTPETCLHQLARLRSAGHTVGPLESLRDVDTVADAAAVAGSVPGSVFEQVWSRVGGVL